MSLVVLPSMPGTYTPDGKIILTKRFINGMLMNLRHWDVPMSVILEPGGPIEGTFDRVEVEPDSLPFKVEVMPYEGPRFADVLGRHLVTLATVSHRQNRIPEVCRAAGTACVYVAEFSLKTRYQIARASTRNPLLLARRLYWQADQERRHRRAIGLADGIQCNGTPCYDSYAPISKNCLLFFDTRAEREMLATPEDLDAREAHLMRGGPIRLLFSGQFTKVKGVDHLVEVARELRRLGVPFEFTLCRGGPIEPQVRADIERHHLGDCMKLAGVLDFRTQLHPLTKSKTDLFVCCHIQGDPSQTYIDVMTCGVPIAGYDNEALAGITRYSQSNRIVPMYRPDRLAEAIAGLAADRGTLMALARKTLEFSRQHTFDEIYRNRIEHIQECRRQFEASNPARTRLAKVAR